MKIFAYEEPKKYGVLVFDITGEPVQDRQRCADTIKEGLEIAKNDMKDYVFSCACVYKTVRDTPVSVRLITCSGRVLTPNNKIVR